MAEPEKQAVSGPSEAPRGEHWWHHIHLQHGGFRREIISLGHWSSIVFMLLISVTPWVPEFLYPYHKWIGLGYIVIQFAEVNAEDHLHNKEVLWDHLLSAFPFLLGLVWVSLHWYTGTFVLGHGWETLKFYTACATFDFVAGVVVNNTILNAPYQREEQEKH